MPHIHEHIDFTIAAYITNNNRVLLIHHKQLNKWLPIGGHIELNEDPEEALYREISEECGLAELEVMSSRPTQQHSNGRFLYTPNYLDIHNINETHKHIGITYFLKTKSDRVTLEKDAHNEIKWFTTEEMKKPEFAIQSDVIFYSEKALAKSKVTIN
ncbi:MAG: NUDIX hydrolase [uncultured bacterium]|nr:MAG: NUDIX hydrolase [uncultured bacterium]